MWPARMTYFDRKCEGIEPPHGESSVSIVKRILDGLLKSRLRRVSVELRGISANRPQSRCRLKFSTADSAYIFSMHLTTC